jgi:hypothetical protein
VRRILELFATSALRSRVGVAIVLLVVVFGVIGVARVMSGPADDAGPYLGAPDRPVSTVNPTEGDDGVVESAPGTDPTAEPVVTVDPGTPRPEDVARAFASAWLDQDATPKRWHAHLLPHMTPALAEKLDGVDPVIVPADRLTGPATVIPRGEQFLEVVFPVDTGKLRLRLVAPGGRWLVDGVDWERS